MSPSGGESRIARGGAQSLAFRVLSTGCDTLIVVVTARGFGVDGRGIYALVTFASALMVTVLGGTTAAFAAEIAHDRTSLGRLYAGAAAIAGLGGGALALIVGAFALITWPDHEGLLYAALATPFLLLEIYQLTLYQAQNEIRRMHYLYLAKSAVPLIALTVIAVAEPDRIYLALGAWTAAHAVVSLTALFAQHRDAPLLRQDMRDLARRLLRRGLPVSLGNAIVRLNYRVDLIVVAILLPLTDVGLYSVAIAVGEALWVLPRAIMTGAYTAIVASPNEGDAVRVTQNAFRHSASLVLMSGAAVLVGAHFLLGPVFGDEFSDVWTPLALLLPGVVALGLVEVLREYFLVRLERSREYLTMATVSMTMNLALAFALVPIMGLDGAALSTSISYCCAAVYLVGRFAHVSGAHDIRGYLPGRRELRDYVRLVGSLAPGR